MIWQIVVGVILGIIFIFLIYGLARSIRIVPQTQFYVVERLGKFHRVLNNGIHFLIPFIDRVRLRENFKEKVFDFAAQDVITKDNATIKVDTVVYLQITDPKLYTYGAEQPKKAIENLSATTLRNLLGELELDETLTSRDTINTKLADILDAASDNWGIKVHRVELKNILPPRDIQQAMEKQMRAEREKRANILEAEGFKVAAILEAEGKKEALVLNSQAIKQASILEAEGQKKAIELLTSARISERVLNWKALEELGKLGQGKATKIIIPPDLKNIARAMSVASGVFGEDKNLFNANEFSPPSENSQNSNS